MCKSLIIYLTKKKLQRTLMSISSAIRYPILGKWECKKYFWPNKENFHWICSRQKFTKLIQKSKHIKTFFDVHTDEGTGGRTEPDRLGYKNIYTLYGRNCFLLHVLHDYYNCWCNRLLLPKHIFHIIMFCENLVQCLWRRLE